MDFGAGTGLASASSSLTALANSKLATPSTSFNSFLDKVASRLSPSRNLIGRPFARQNALERMQMRGDPILAFDWIGVIIDPTVNVGRQLPWEYIDSITTPSLSVEPHQLFFNGVTKKFASLFSADTIAIKMFTDTRGVTMSFVNSWVRSTYRDDGFYNLSSKYKKDIQVFLLDATRSIVTDIRFVGCFPTSWDSYTLGTDNSMLETSLTLSVDEVFINYDSEFSAIKDTINGLANSLLSKGQQVGSSLIADKLAVGTA